MENLEENQPPRTEPIPQAQTPETKPKQSILLPILLSLVMFILGGSIAFAYFVFLKPEKVVPQPVVSPSPVASPTPSPSPDITADWETYRNEEYEFEVKYPNAWIQETIVSSGWIKFISPNKENYFSIEAGSKGGITGSTTIDNYCESHSKLPKKLERYSLSINDIPAVYCLDKNDEEEMLVYFLVQKDNLQYEIRGSFDKQDEETNLRLFQQILSTFKFTE